jgi:hypothetical protein
MPVPVRKPNQQDVVAFWQLVCSIPAPENPYLDDTGKWSLRGQETSTGLLYLSGSNGPARVRNIPQNIASGRDIFFAVNPVVVTEPEAGTNDTGKLKQFAKDDEDPSSSATVAKLTINNGQTENLIPNNRVGTNPFSVTFPENAIFNAPKGEFPAVADGYYAIIEGLPSGNNKIDIEAQVNKPFPGFKEPVPWKDKVTYHIKIS